MKVFSCQLIIAGERHPQIIRADCHERIGPDHVFFVTDNEHPDRRRAIAKLPAVDTLEIIEKPLSKTGD